MRCDNCNYEYSTENFDYCPKCGHKIKKNNSIIFFALKIILIYIIIDFIISGIISFLPTYYSDTKYGVSLIYEMVVAFISILLVFLFKNTYIFKEKRIGFFKGLIIAVPILIFPILIMITSVGDVLTTDFSVENFITTILLFIFVGIYEELLCRGVIQNEFVERFGKTRKQVLFSILSASLIFGCMHITNVFAGQTLFETIIQIAQATCFGMVFGIIYYRTKNITLNIFLHGFYDFGISFATNNIYWDSKTIATGPISMKISIISTIFLCLIHITAFIILFRNIKQVPSNKPKKDILQYGIIAYIVLLVLNGNITNSIIKSNKDKYELEQKNNIIKYEYKSLQRFTDYIKIDTSKTNKQSILLEDIFGIKKELVLKKENSKYYISLNDNKIELPFSFSKSVIICNDNDIELLLSDISHGYYIKVTKEELENNFNILLDKDKYKKINYPKRNNIGYIKDNKNNKSYIYIQTRDPLKTLVLDNGELKIIES